MFCPECRAHHGRMLGPDDIADVEGDADVVRRMAGMDGPCSMADMARELTRRDVVVCDDLGSAEGCFRGGRVCVRPGLAPERLRHTIGHEIGEWYYALIGYEGDDIEERCDALGAALAVPRVEFRRAVGAVGHRVFALAAAFGVQQSVALLRLGEVTGRPVALLRPTAPIYRGDPFEWPRTSALVRALREGRGRVHPIRIVDSPDRWGLMACASFASEPPGA